jgi:lipoprotein-anchoring transpeptidase ErfK/SrfK
MLAGNNVGAAPMQNQKICVTVKSQTLDLLSEDGKVIKSYKISTSRFGLGSEVGSNKTPTGNFRIADKIGDGATPGEIFQSRISTGKFGKDGDPADYVQTRILWLDGIESQNANTHDRFIYIHGTNSESKLGTPASYGCVRMSNLDVIDLYDRVPVGTPVEIIPGT